jgi:hypothetical protein
MAGTITALVVSACGHDTVAGQSTAQSASKESLPVPTAPAGSYSITPTPGTAKALWAEMAGVSWGPNTTYGGASKVSPIYSPKSSTGNIDAVGREGNKCVVAYAAARGVNPRFGVVVYLEYDGQLWGFGKDNVDYNDSDLFVGNYDPYCLS